MQGFRQWCLHEKTSPDQGVTGVKEAFSPRNTLSGLARLESIESLDKTTLLGFNVTPDITRQKPALQADSLDLLLMCCPHFCLVVFICIYYEIVLYEL